jgi:hypothetical protein
MWQRGSSVQSLPKFSGPIRFLAYHSVSLEPSPPFYSKRAISRATFSSLHQSAGPLSSAVLVGGGVERGARLLGGRACIAIGVGSSSFYLPPASSISSVRVRIPVQVYGDGGFGAVVSGEICIWVRFPGGASLVEEAALPCCNKLLLVFVHLAFTISGAGGRPVRWCRTRSGGCSSDPVVRCAGVLSCLHLLGTATLCEDASGEALGTAASRYGDLVPLLPVFRRDGQIWA